jgi:hypothetical protein
MSARWYVGGRIEAHANSFSALASDLADRTFGKAPVIRSELVNREKPSSNSQAAVRQVLHAMVTHPDQEYLGIQGYPAERGLYSTVLQASGLHGMRPDGTYGFMDPSAEHRNGASFVPTWQLTKSILEDADGLVPLSALYEAWAAPPYGIRRGLLPILA